MENKEKQMIEKTIDILYDLNDTYKSLPREQLENAIKFGSYYDVVKLIKLGYRKINENEVVLTKEAYDKLCHLAYFGYDDAYEKGYKQGVKEFANFLKSFMGIERDFIGIKYKQGVFSDYEIDDLVEEFNNIKEN